MTALDFCMVFALPITLLLVGIFWRIKPPKWKKSKFAYCTPLSCSCQEAWDLAHKKCSHLWILIGEMILFCCSAFLIDLVLKISFDHHS